MSLLLTNYLFLINNLIVSWFLHQVTYEISLLWLVISVIIISILDRVDLCSPFICK